MEEYKFKCEFCDYRANRRDYMKKHMLKKYPCNGDILQEEIDYIKDKSSGNASVVGLKNNNKWLKRNVSKMENEMNALKKSTETKIIRLKEIEQNIVLKQQKLLEDEERLLLKEQQLKPKFNFFG